MAQSDDDLLFFALTRIHVRACLVASEIRALLFSGHASGAMSRWRTLHELTVVVMFLKKCGKDAADRYLEHSFIMLAKAAEEHMQHQRELGFDLITEDELQRIREERDSLITKHGASFKSDYGWAADYIGKQKPTFTDIEEFLERGHWKPYVRLASQSVHAGFRGMQHDLGYGKFNPEVMLAGPSNVGFVDPAQCSIIDLNLVTVALLSCRPTVKSTVAIHALNALVDDCIDAFVQATRRLEADERRLREMEQVAAEVETEPRTKGPL